MRWRENEERRREGERTVEGDKYFYTLDSLMREREREREKINKLTDRQTYKRDNEIYMIK